jgi:hypothetical protein
VVAGRATVDVMVGGACCGEACVFRCGGCDEGGGGENGCGDPCVDSIGGETKDKGTGAADEGRVDTVRARLVLVLGGGGTEATGCCGGGVGSCKAETDELL